MAVWETPLFGLVWTCTLLVAAGWAVIAHLKLRRANRDLRQVRYTLAASSHDLLQPLSAARLFNSTLRNRIGPDEQGRLLSGRVEKSLDAAQDLLEGMLDVSRLDAGTLHAAK